MNDPLDTRLRQLSQELHDAAPPAPSWNAVVARTAPIGPAGRRSGSDGRRRPVWLGWATAAMLVAGVVGVAAVSRARHDRSEPAGATTPDPTTVPGSSAAPTTAPAPTVAPTTSAIATTTTQDTAVPSGAAPSPLPVSYLDPPPTLVPEVFTSVDVPAGDHGPGYLPLAAVLDDGSVALVDDVAGEFVVVDDQGSRRLPMGLDQAPAVMSGGPGRTLYAVVPAPQPDRLGAAARVILAIDAASVRQLLSVADVGLNGFVGTGPLTLGPGPEAITDRRSGEPLIPYVDPSGTTTVQPIDAPLYTLGDDGTITDAAGDPRWRLAVERAPDNPSPYVADDPPVALPGGWAVYTTAIGGPVDAQTDYPDARTRVLALLAPDGTGQWSTIEDGWHVLAADIWGAVLARRSGDQVELARLPIPDGGTIPAEVVPATTDIGLPDCPRAGDCVHLSAGTDGTVVAFDAAAGRFTVADAVTGDASSVDLATPLGADAYLALVGPDQVAYLSVRSAGTLDPIGDLVAVALRGPRAGEIVARTDEVVDLSGDSDLVATVAGVVSVGCCGSEARRPDPAAVPTMTWVDGEGRPTTDTRPQVGLITDGRGGWSAAIDRSDDPAWALPSSIFVRGMPWTAVGEGPTLLIGGYDGMSSAPFLLSARPGAPMVSLSLPRGWELHGVAPSGFIVRVDGGALRLWPVGT